ncbi:GNAT family N-acetyltransferase [Niveispirillum sp. SYP-B3756]|uniref:GNAT family N-acetyltransferase n=1 Tax=Niveispirillum sp. SYP-B3756 TaxID=2662178 RepID=UPI001290AC00|nr:GNAT family protein [Niveispirillum sp. SYP-B3756]MQP67316.1 GNAT family N-acetyltransferase [Niveispirillum sp. SYP-B3756]
MSATPAALSFRLPVQDDAATLLAWRRLPEVTSNSFTDIDDDLDKQRAWIERCNTRNDYHHRIIQVDGVDVGYASITITQPLWGVGSIGTYMGDRRGRTGIGALNFAPVLNHCFYTLGLRKLVNQIFADNDRVRKGQTMLGYRHVGVLHAHAMKNGVPRDVHLFEMLAEDWAAIRHRFSLLADMDGRVW